MSRVATKPTMLCEACQLPDWPEERVINGMRDGSVPYEGYPPGRRIDWERAPKIDCRTNIAEWLTGYPAGNGVVRVGTICLRGIKVYLPISPSSAAVLNPTVRAEKLSASPTDAKGVPLRPGSDDAQAALALPADAGNAPASTSEADPDVPVDPDVPTLRQEMILAILDDQKFPDGVSRPRRPTQLTEIVRQGWEAERARRPGVKYPPPDRKTVTSTVKRWRS